MIPGIGLMDGEPGKRMSMIMERSREGAQSSNTFSFHH